MNLTDYIQGHRKGKDAHRIEREAMRDAFLTEALEGFEAVSGDHAEAIRQMQQNIAVRSQPKGRSVTFWFSMAASIALVIGFGWYFLLHETPPATIFSEAPPSAAIPADSLTRNEIIAMAESTEKVNVTEPAVQNRAISSKILYSPQLEEDIEIMNDNVSIEVEMIKEDKDEDALEPIIAHSLRDTRQVQGKVVDKTGEPLPGATIIVKNTANGVVTDVNGEFSLKADDQTILQASFVGYETQELVADTSKLLIAMNESKSDLEEVIVVGYGTRRKASETGSISVVPEQLQKIVPEPVIGRRAYQKYLRENIVRPVDGACLGVKGKVQVRFSVDAAGRPYNFQITGKLCDDADGEAKRLIMEGCDWTQGNTEATVTVEFR